MSATTTVQVVTESRDGWLTMRDVATFVQVWAAMAEFGQVSASDADLVEPTVYTEGQGGRFKRIMAVLREETVP